MRPSLAATITFSGGRPAVAAVSSASSTLRALAIPSSWRSIAPASATDQRRASGRPAASAPTTGPHRVERISISSGLPPRTAMDARRDSNASVPPGTR